MNSLNNSTSLVQPYSALSTLFSHLMHLGGSKPIDRHVFQMSHSFLKYSENLNESNYVSCLKIDSIGRMLPCSVAAIFLFALNYFKKEKYSTMCSKLIKASTAFVAGH